MTPMIGIAGYMRAGKSTVARHLVGAHGFCEINFADALRDALNALDPYVDGNGRGTRLSHAARTYEYDDLKTAYPEVRRLLQVLGTEVGRDILGADVWVHAWRRRVDCALGPIVAGDVRFPNEAEAVRQLGGEVWWVERPGCGPSAHASERSIGPGDCDTVIHNVGDLTALRRVVEAWLA